jgi:DNA polymerase-3 subunit alpha
MTTKKDFVHLHLHTDFSLLNSSIQIKPLVNKLEEFEMPGCAITDQGNMYGAISFYNALKSAGKRPILGYEAYLTLGSRLDKGASLRAGEMPYYPLVLLAETLEGYYNLVYLASKAFTEGFYYKPRIDLEILEQHSKGLIALSGGPKGVIENYLKNDSDNEARQYFDKFISIFGNDSFFLEIQDHGLEEEREFNRKWLEFAKNVDASLAATNDAFYLSKDDARAHEILLCIGEGKTINDPSRSQLGAAEFYVKSPAEMWRLFGKEIPEALTNTNAIAERCNVKLPKADDQLHLPNYPIPSDSGCATAEEYFEKVAKGGFEQRNTTIWKPARELNALKYELEHYQTRITREIETINKMGYPGYFLIVWDFIKYAKERGIPVGPGRGSAAGSLVAYCLGITDVDPLQNDLLFERFLNPERVSMPDIDIDFCVRGRGEVINHVTERYGRDSVCQIITFGTMASRAAIKDVGRAMEIPYSEVEKIAKMIPPPERGRNVSIEDAIGRDGTGLKKAMAANPQVKELVDTAKKLEGCSRHSSVHAAGVVISPKPLHELVPVAYSSKDELTSQYAMNDLEKAGMLKMDFLALTTLTIINDCLGSIKSRLNTEIDWLKVSLNDEKTMKLFCDGRTEGIFQFESPGMQEICRRLKPKELEDLAALNALYRPGPLDGGMVEDFIDRHHGKKKVQYIVPEMKDILSNTYGVLVYQEQIMQIAQKLAGYSLGAADLMRRAMGKKKREEMAKHEEMFISGAVKNGVKRDKAVEIFRLMAQFADYGFNRSHSVAYAYLAFQTGYLKAHYPSYFYAAVLSNESNDTAKIYKYSVELKHLGIELLPPDVNESDLGFTPTEKAVRFGLSAIKGMGNSTVNSILAARREGRFISLSDFTSRLEPGSINRRAMEGLVCAGAFDSIKPANCPANVWRARLHAGIENALSFAQKVWNDRIKGQNDLFGGFDEQSLVADDGSELPDCPAWPQQKLAAEEKKAIGFYLTTHPLLDYSSLLEQLNAVKVAELSETSGAERLTIGGVVSGLQIRQSKRGNRYATFNLEDDTDAVKCFVWGEAFTKFNELLAEDQVLCVTGRYEASEQQENSFVFEDAVSLVDAVPSKAQKVVVTLPRQEMDQAFLDDLFQLLSQNKGDCEVFFDVDVSPDKRARLSSHQTLRVKGSKSFEDKLREQNCHVNWVVNN